jgi:signal peptidase I
MATSKGKSGLLATLSELGVILLLAVAAKTAIAEPFYVPSGSMEPTLLVGDELVASKFAYGYGSASLPSFLVLPSTKRFFGALPHRGDVVVFRWPGDRAQTWVKRVIGLPGDRIALHAGQVWINGEAAPLRPDGKGDVVLEDGSKTSAARFVETLPGGREHAIFKLGSFPALDDIAEFTVPQGRLFVMGDNRDDSADSRIPVTSGGVGFLPVDDLVGRVDGLIGSWDFAMKSRPLWEWPAGLRFARFFSAVH